ncbi:hypothetical protein N7541_003289 [Penicillium brevicompactum]|uniref:Uncharacterized protein n=1 Tax=Penicillium brevicompactum TaxID=5074 RepID=A0A9W9RMV3_PENBR|nr:hypothetical protein N7541_003289 [Penicillium brevicompactum]
MPLTRLQRSREEAELLPGLPATKRVRRAATAGSSASSKGKGKAKSAPLPHVAFARALLKRGPNFKPPTPPQQTKGERRIWGRRAVAITNKEDVPDGWSVNEPDLEETDVDGQIERCNERIAEGILPDFFKTRLERYTAIRQHKIDMINSEPKGLSWEVVQRLDELKKLHELLEEEDKEENISNVKAIMDAYRSKRLSFTAGLVTFWSHGKLVSGPKKLNMEEFYALHAKHGAKGFWVEGFQGPKPIQLNYFFSLNAFIPGWAQHHITISIRNPTTKATNTDMETLHLEFLEDTGATTMALFENDVFDLELMSGAPLPGAGSTLAQTANGQKRIELKVVEANIFMGNQPLLPNWVEVAAAVSPKPTGFAPARLSGVWIHHMLFVVSMPDNTQRKHIGNDMWEMFGNLIIPDSSLAIPPEIPSPVSP